jgi:SPP1 gp7 family putative phage head morphogenesis protein
MAGPLIPKEALAYIKNKILYPGFSYKDVWHEEHAAMFTAAKAMQADVLSDIKSAVEKAIENGETLDSFRKNLAPLLQAKGWWGKKEMIDPLTGKTVNAQLGSGRRLKTVYDTNLRSAYQEGRWERSQASTSHPYLMYRVGNSRHHRQEHLAWDGLILPKDDPWWDSHYPPNGWGCKCWTMAVTEERKQRLEKSGIAVPPSADGTPGRTVAVRTEAPPTAYKTFYTERKGTIERVPEGIDPAFNWNVGLKKRR